MIGDKVKKLRKEQGLTQYQLAVRAFVTPLTIVNLENGNRQPIPAVVKTIADALGVTVEDLEGDKERRDTPNGNEVPDNTD
jgi:transcriptional regulator with XRE-family HTH domain